MYWGLRRWLAVLAPPGASRSTLVDTTDLAGVQAAMRPAATQLVWLETPANPTWEVTDIAAIAATRPRGRRSPGGRLHRRDSGAHPPARARRRPRHALGDQVPERPLRRHRRRAGHAPGRRLWTRIAPCAPSTAARLGTFEAWLLLRGMRTLSCASAAQSPIGRSASPSGFAEHPHVSRPCSTPGCRTHPGHAVAARQMQGGFGGMLSIRVRAARPRPSPPPRAWRSGSAPPRSAASRA